MYGQLNGLTIGVIDALEVIDVTEHKCCLYLGAAFEALPFRCNRSLNARRFDKPVKGSVIAIRSNCCSISLREEMSSRVPTISCLPASPSHRSRSKTQIKRRIDDERGTRTPIAPTGFLDKRAPLPERPVNPPGEYALAMRHG